MDDDVKDALDALTSQVADLKSQVDALTQTLTGVNNMVTEDGTKMNEIERLSIRIDLLQEQADKTDKAIEDAKTASGDPADAAAKADAMSKKVDDLAELTDRIRNYLSSILPGGLVIVAPGGPIVVPPFV
jgi:predicted  nucleic acid-binding Zn-ribbon protein